MPCTHSAGSYLILFFYVFLIYFVTSLPYLLHQSGLFLSVDEKFTNALGVFCWCLVGFLFAVFLFLGHNILSSLAKLQEY